MTERVKNLKDHVNGLEIIIIISLIMMFIESSQENLNLRSYYVPLFILGIFLRPLTRFLGRNWMKYSSYVASFFNSIILSIFYFLFFWPLSLLFKAFRKNIKSEDSTLINVDQELNFKKPW
jgi:hypothetical protein